MAPRVSTFIRTALIGRITEPVMRNRATIVVSAITVMAHGRCAARLAFWSTKPADTPPTSVG